MILFLISCGPSVSNYKSKIIREDTTNLQEKIDRIESEVAFELADGIEVSLWASDSLAPDPVAMSIDEFGSVYLTRTNRQKNSEFDIRGHRDWMTASIGLQTVEDRRQFLRNTFSPEKNEENNWLPDLNGDTIHDWKDLAVEKEEIWKLEDINGDGVADISTRVLEDFNEEVTDVAGALLVRRNDVFVGAGPDMWRVWDKDGNGILDEKQSISHGYAVHIGFGGHGMSGAVQGPDGKIYWGIGDIGANITSVAGQNFKYPNQGVLVRSNPDGTNFEVFAAGLRNTHEFAFDKYGNIIGADNDGDHPTEKERLVHIVEGSDQGWRINWQFGKYTDPKNNDYKVWMEERLWEPRWDGQAAYIMPPLANIHNGPTGFVYNPGTALGSKWVDKFFVVEFTGTPSRSPIWAFDLVRDGASFRLNEEVMFAKGILPTGIRFGADGALYAADWIFGWGTKNYGRVWKFDVTNDENNLGEQRIMTKGLLEEEFKKKKESTLLELLAYDDMRIRLKAQFELVRRASEKTLFKSIDESKNQLARIHGIWGIGQLVEAGEVDPMKLTKYLSDEDDEIVVQTLKVLGDARFTNLFTLAIPLISHSNPRIQFYCTQAMGRIQAEESIDSILKMLEENDDQDLYIRHAGVLALSRTGEIGPILELENHPKKSMRTVAVLVLRRIRSPEIVRFLDDESEYIVTEAARAINDDWSIVEALPNLAGLLAETKFKSEALLRRSINAALRVGGLREVELLINFAGNEMHSEELRAEALLALSTWPSPSVHDRVDGRYREVVIRDPAEIAPSIVPSITTLLNDNSSDVVKATTKLISGLQITTFNPQLADIAENHPSAEVRSGAIESLVELQFDDLGEIILVAMKDRDESVRNVGISNLDQLDLDANALPWYIDPIFEKGTYTEQQALLGVLKDLSKEVYLPILNSIVQDWIGGKYSKEITLDIVEAVDSSGDEELIASIEQYRLKGNTTEDYRDVLFGGDGSAGATVFWENTAAQCMRCHGWDNEAGSVGPSLRGVADRLPREEILESLIEPSSKLAAGFGSVAVKLTDGSSVTGILLEEKDQKLFLKTNEAEPLEIPLARIETRQNLPSSMPPMGSILSKREIRDLLEYLSGLKSD